MIGDVIQVVKDTVEGLGQLIPYYGSVAVSATVSRVYPADRMNLFAEEQVVIVGSDEFEVTDVNCEAGFVDLLSTEAVPVLLSGAGVLTIETAPLRFYHGTLSEVSGQLDTIQDLSAEVPFVWMIERMSSDLDVSDDALITDNAPIRLLFLTTDKREEQRTPALYNSVIRPMETLAKEVIQAFKRSPLIGEFSSVRETSHVRASISNDNRGATANIFNHDFSGVELSLTLPLESEDCDC